jgi:pimeloyl-ACP methyl ester carboxylesterase
MRIILRLSLVLRSAALHLCKKSRPVTFSLTIFLLIASLLSPFPGKSQTFRVNIAGSLQQGALDGRLLLLLSNNDKEEPRFLVNDAAGTQLVFGMDIDGWQPGSSELVDMHAFGYPIERLRDVPAGDYYVQALLHKYETFHLKGGHTVKLPMDRGEGQHWNQAPGNIYSKPVKIHFDPATSNEIGLTIDQLIPPIPEPRDSRYVKHIKIQSKLLSEFWGRPMYIGAHILLPEGFDEHPNSKFPLAIFHGHFPADFGGFRTEPPEENLKPDTNARFRITGYNKIVQQEAYDFYKQWTGPGFPRVLAVEIEHANPYYDDSYAVNSENLGPYGDAITYELIPEIERRFRGIGQGWARFTYGGSTGGWEALAVQVLYPDQFNGCYASCPDPVDFHHYTTIDIYNDRNAYYVGSDYKRTPRPGYRDYLGHVSAMVKEMNQRELALGTRSRSGDQFDIWEAVFSPRDQDGYPKRIFDKYTGAIDSSVASYWKEHFDLTHIIQRDWPKIGEQLKGKIHIYVGEMDSYYLNNAVYSAEDMLKKLTGPACHCQVDYGDRAEHCWNGDHAHPNYISRLRYHQMYIKKWAEEVKGRCPKGADLVSWRY